MRRLDELQRRRPVIGFPLAVVYKFADDQGVYLAALLTYYGFLSVFPLLLLLASVLGFVLQNDGSLRAEILESTISQFPVFADQLRDPQGLTGSGIALLVGALTALYGALGVGQALQHAANVAWAVPRNCRPNPLKARGISLLVLATGGVAVLAITTLSLLAGSAGARFGAPDSWAAVTAAIGAVVVNTAVFAVVLRIATARRLRGREVVPGATFSALVWQLLQVFGSAYVADCRARSDPRLWRVRRRAGAARMDVPGGPRGRRRHRDQRRRQQAPVPEGAAGAVHGPGRPHRR